MDFLDLDSFDEDIELEEEKVDDEELSDSDPLMVEPFDPTLINIIPKQDTLRNIIDRLRNDEIDMNTDFQRHADLWRAGQMSKLIESILIRFPLPAFYFDASDDDKWLVVDGLQRLSSIRKFVVEEKLRLTNLEFLHDLKSKTYKELPRQYQRRIDECPVTLFLIQPNTPPNVKYSIFRRINTGGLVLNNQEIRNALARPRERKFLQRLATDDFLRKTMGNQSKRMMDHELVLRFISFYVMNYLKSPKNIAEFLDEGMDYLKRATDKELSDIENAFKKAIKIGFEIFGDAAFEKRSSTNSSKRKRKNTTLFEVWTVCLSELSATEAKKLVQNKTIVIKSLQALIENDEAFFRSISLATQKKEHVTSRYTKVRQIIKDALNAA